MQRAERCLTRYLQRPAWQTRRRRSFRRPQRPVWCGVARHLRRDGRPSPTSREEAAPMALEEGKAAPAFTLPDANGNAVSLKDFAGKDVILYFYPKDDTPGCTKEACGFRDDWKTLQKIGAVVLGVSGDNAA